MVDAAVADDDVADDDVADDAVADEEEPLPHWASRPRVEGGGVPSLQELCCEVLAKHLHAIGSLELLPDHLAELVRAAIQRDRRLIDDQGLAVWLGAVSRGGSTTRLDLRWASSLTDHGLKMLATEEAMWASTLLELDLSFCELISDAGMKALAPALTSLNTLVLTGCTRCADGACEAIGRHMSQLERIELELLALVTDVGVQAIVRGCGSRLCDLRLGSCYRITSVSTSLVADHCRTTIRHLGLGGLSTLNDIDCEEIGRCHGLTGLELCACPKVSDAGIKQIGLLASRQMKAYAAWDQRSAAFKMAGGSAPPPPTLTFLDLGGLTRLSDEALQKLLARTAHLTSLDLRGCTRLEPNGLTTVFAGKTIDGVQTSVSLPVPRLQTLTLTSVDAANDRVASLITEARPALALKR